jgi:hypothetical protein
VSRLIRKVLTLAFVTAVAVNGYLIAAILKNRFDLQDVKSHYGLPPENRPDARLLGFDARGSAIELLSGGRGTAIWYATKDCPYCNRDAEWTSLAAALKAKGLQVLILLPGQSHRFASESRKVNGAQQMAFVSGEWLAQFPLLITPTLLIFDGNERLIWHRRGMLSATDSASALRAVEMTNPTRQ